MHFLCNIASNKQHIVFLTLQEPAEREPLLVIAVRSRSSTEADVITVVLEEDTIDPGVL